jgi:hypothetical protein
MPFKGRQRRAIVNDGVAANFAWASACWAQHAPTCPRI